MCSAQHSTSQALHCTALHCTALHCTARHGTARHCTALHCTALHCTALHGTALHCTALHCGNVSPKQTGLYRPTLTFKQTRCRGLVLTLYRPAYVETGHKAWQGGSCVVPTNEVSKLDSFTAVMWIRIDCIRIRIHKI